ncbi:MAG: hypothetical protein IKW90_10065 [Lachnospiraceae bacterium]|nr:hypothetical protein [Lachnospiraceae bacterium]MBR5179125.1 hypothetical protein [Lachnospiraceae bacterium]
MITPIEMYTMVPKSQEASIVHSTNIAKQVAQQQSGMQEIAHEARVHEQQVVQATAAENPEYRYDAKEKGNGSYSEKEKKKKKKENESEQKENGTDTGVHSGFDIRI